MKDFDYILNQLGPFGRYQFIHWITLGLAIVPSGMQNMLNVYISAIPEHWCHVPELTNLSVSDQRRLTTAPGGESDACSIPDVDYDRLYEGFLKNDTSLLNESSVTRTCSQWQYDYELYGETAVTKWDLVCSKSAMPALAQSIYMLGFLVGAVLFGYISDRYGRKMSLYVGIVGVITFGVLSCFMPEFWSHVTIRFIAGVSACCCITIPFVMVMEMTGPTKRLVPGLCAQVYFALGYMLLALIANFTRDFMLTNLVMSLLPIGLICYWWTEDESARWLLAQDRVNEARDVLKKMAKTNRSQIDVDFLLKEHIQQSGSDSSMSTVSLPQHTIIDLLRTPNMRKKSLNLMFNWFVTSMVYYGLSMGVTELGGNPYVNLFISGVMECFSVMVCCFTLDRFGRRMCLAMVLIVGGLACLVSGLMPQDYQNVRIVLSMIGKFGVSGSFAIIYLFSAELFPTVVRSIGVGAGSMSARIGGLMAPFVAEMRYIWAPLPSLVFGASAIAAGLLSFLFPETLGKTLPDTMEEGEMFGKDASFMDCYKPTFCDVEESKPNEKQDEIENDAVISAV